MYISNIFGTLSSPPFVCQFLATDYVTDVFKERLCMKEEGGT